MDLRLVTLILELAVACVLGHPFRNQLFRKSTSKNGHYPTLGMYDGKNTTINKHPYMAAVHFMDIFAGAAVILTDKWLITTADVVPDTYTNVYTVAVRSEDGYYGYIYNVKQIIIHPKFDHNTVDYDYTLLELPQPLKFSKKIQPIKLPSQAPKAGTDMTVSGYGFSEQQSDLSEELGKVIHPSMKEGHMQWLDKTTCNETYYPYIPWTDSKACAYNKGKTTLCKDDWADPFVKDGVLYGIFVLGLSQGFCTQDASPLLLSDISYVADWIRATTGAKFDYE